VGEEDGESRPTHPLWSEGGRGTPFSTFDTVVVWQIRRVHQHGRSLKAITPDTCTFEMTYEPAWS
jgi:hypothetical protein